MREVLTKSMARNIFLGGSLFFMVIFVGLTVHSHNHITGTATPPVTEEVAAGKHVWERHTCINCHTILGEGAYFAPELGNVMTRWGVAEDPEAAYQVLSAWMMSQPTGIEGRRQMPQFDLTEDEIRALSAFLLWVDEIDAQDWPPNDAG